MSKIKQALEAVQHIFLCEDEGMASGQPTKEDYLQARELVAAALAELEAAKPTAQEKAMEEAGDAKPKWDADVWFRKLIEGMVLRTHPDRPNVNLWDGLINGERVTLFEQKKKTGTVLCRWRFVWLVLEEKYNTGYADIQTKMKHLLEKHLKWQVKTVHPIEGLHRRRWRNISNGG